jgi:hypothetical protein
VLAQLLRAVRVEARHERAGRSDAECERLPPLVEGVVFDMHGERVALDVEPPGLGQQLGEVPLARTCEARLVRRVGVQVPRRLPERRER